MAIIRYNIEYFSPFLYMAGDIVDLREIVNDAFHVHVPDNDAVDNKLRMMIILIYKKRT